MSIEICECIWLYKTVCQCWQYRQWLQGWRRFFSILVGQSLSQTSSEKRRAWMIHLINHRWKCTRFRLTEDGTPRRTILSTRWRICASKLMKSFRITTSKTSLSTIRNVISFNGISHWPPPLIMLDAGFRPKICYSIDIWKRVEETQLSVRCEKMFRLNNHLETWVRWA